MITKNFKNLAACLLQASGSGYGMLPVTNVSNTVYYVYPSFNGFPYSRTQSYTSNATSAGISVGSGNTAATEDDYQLESTITSGLSAQVNIENGFDNDGNPYVRFDVMLTNTTANAITVNEIGYKQNIYAATAQGSSGGSGRVCLLDRTVFATPVEIAAGGYQVIRYTLKTTLPSTPSA